MSEKEKERYEWIINNPPPKDIKEGLENIKFLNNLVFREAIEIKKFREACADA